MKAQRRRARAGCREAARCGGARSTPGQGRRSSSTAVEQRGEGERGRISGDEPEESPPPVAYMGGGGEWDCRCGSCGPVWLRVSRERWAVSAQRIVAQK